MTGPGALAQRVLLIALVVVTVLVGRRLLPPSLGFAGRLVALVGLVLVVLWAVSAATRLAAARGRPPLGPPGR